MKELLYRKISGKIKEDIKNGDLPAGSRLPGVRELAEEWDTSTNTVLKALDELEAGGYISKTRGQGIFVQPKASWNSDAEPERVLELILYDMDVPFNRLLISSIERVAADYSFRLTVKSSSAPEKLAPLQIGARIIVPSTAPIANDENTAVIYTGEFSPPSCFSGNYAVVDSYGGFYRAAGFLLESGCERIAYIGAADNLEDEPGWNACRDALSGSRHGFRREYAVSAGGWNAAMGQAAMEKLLLDGEFPDGLLCSNDSLAAGALKTCRAAGLTVPGDISIIGAGDQDIAPLLDPPLTSLKMPAAVLGLIVVSFADSILEGRTGAAHRLRARLDMELVVRESAQAAEDDSIWV